MASARGRRISRHVRSLVEGHNRKERHCRNDRDVTVGEAQIQEPIRDRTGHAQMRYHSAGERTRSARSFASLAARRGRAAESAWNIPLTGQGDTLFPGHAHRRRLRRQADRVPNTAPACAQVPRRFPALGAFSSAAPYTRSTLRRESLSRATLLVKARLLQLQSFRFVTPGLPAISESPNPSAKGGNAAPCRALPTVLSPTTSILLRIRRCRQHAWKM